MIPKLKHMTVVIEELKAANEKLKQENKELQERINELELNSFQDLGR